MEEIKEEEDRLQVIVFENATEVNFEELIKQDELENASENDSANVDSNNIITDTMNHETLTKQYLDQIDDLDLETQVKNATNENKVFMKYEYTHEKPWIHHADKSAWFNYNFNEKSFKKWVQQIIDRRIQKAKHYQIENVDNFTNSNFTNLYFNDLKNNTEEENVSGKYKPETVKDYGNKRYLEKGMKYDDNYNYNGEHEASWKRRPITQYHDEQNMQTWKKQRRMDHESTHFKNATKTASFNNYNQMEPNYNIENSFDIKGKWKKGEKTIGREWLKERRESKEEEIGKEKEKAKEKEKEKENIRGIRKEKLNYYTKEQRQYNGSGKEHENNSYTTNEKKHSNNIFHSSMIQSKNNKNNISVNYQTIPPSINGNDPKLQSNVSGNETGINNEMQQFQSLINFLKENQDM